MSKPEVSPQLQGYLRGRIAEIAKAETRATSEPLALWAERKIRLDGKPFNFAGHAYLRAIYDDTAPHIVLLKAAQMGGTTGAVLKSIHACRNGLNVMYLFPTRTDVMDFSQSRVKPLLKDNPFLGKQEGPDSMTLKRIGAGILYLRGMQSDVSLKSAPVDMLVFDELDEATPDSQTLAMERMSHSPYKRIIELSNPSLPGYGIDASYQKSDQRHWLMKCATCRTWTCLEKEFPKKLGQEVRIILPRKGGGYYRACVKCGAELDIERGEWVADFPDRPIHGYCMSQLFSSKVDPGEILQEYRTARFPERFYNLKIGIPWTDDERCLDLMSVLSLCTERVMLEKSEEPCVMGVDTGGQLHVVILRPDGEDLEKAHLVHLAVCRNFEDLDALMERFKVDRCVIDGLPEIHETRKFTKRHPGKAFRSFFNPHQRGSFDWNRKERKVTSNRTEALDVSRAAVREQLVTLPRQTPIVKTFADHMTHDAKVLDEDEKTGEKEYRYLKIGGEDHFSLAFTYAWMAFSDQTGVRGWDIYIRSVLAARKAAR